MGAILAVLLAPWVQGASTGCNEKYSQHYVCGLEHPPEDLLDIPDSRWIIASGMGAPGSLYSIDSKTKFSKRLAFSVIGGAKPTDQLYKNCPKPLDQTKFSPHGINARFNKAGPHTLYVVNHGERESIEVFDLEVGSQGPKLSWAGCVVMPDRTNPNSVVPLPKDGFAVTSIFDPTDPDLKETMFSGKPTGKIFEWSPVKGWSIVTGSDLRGNNGLQISSDGQWYFVSGWFGRTLTKLSRNSESGQKKTIDLDFMPDNIRWSNDGDLIVAGHGTTLADFFGCSGNTDGCEPDSIIIKVDPDTLETTTLLRIPGNKDFSTASVAVQVENEIFLGTFAKSRAAVFPHPTQ